MADQPAIGVIEQHAWADVVGPTQRAQPAPETELNAEIYELAVAVALAYLSGVPPALLALTVRGDAGRVGDIELRGHGMQDRDGHGGRVLEAGSQKARRRELTRASSSTDSAAG